MEERQALELLQDLLRRERLPHALLLLGEESSLLSFARKACTLLLESTSEISPDLTFEEIPKPGEDDRLSATELRDRVHASLQLRPVGKRRVLVLLGIENLSPEARDALLKPLEEPPASTVILLGAPDANSVSDTIRSRCRTLRLSTALPAAGKLEQQFHELGIRLESELARTPTQLDPNPYLAEIFGAKRGDLSARREKARQFLHSWMALQRTHWRVGENSAAERAALRADAALTALGDLKKQVTPELALGGMLFSLAGR